MTTETIEQASEQWWNDFGFDLCRSGDTTQQQDFEAAFSAGVAWQQERTSQMQLVAKPAALGGYDAECEFYSEIRDAIGTLGEGMAMLLKQSGDHGAAIGKMWSDLSAAGLRGADRGVAILRHLQEIGDNVRGVSGAIGDKFGVVLDAVKDVGEKVEACMAIASNTEEGLAVSIEKLDKLGVEKWREAIKHVEAEGTTEPMHAEVKAEPTISARPVVRCDHSVSRAQGFKYCQSCGEPTQPKAQGDESGLGKLWADVTVNLEDVSDETLHELLRSEQISITRYIEEIERRVNETGFKAINDKIAATEGFAVEKVGDRVIVLHRGRIYDLRGMDLIPLRFGA